MWTLWWVSFATLCSEEIICLINAHFYLFISKKKLLFFTHNCLVSPSVLDCVFFSLTRSPTKMEWKSFFLFYSFLIYLVLCIYAQNLFTDIIVIIFLVSYKLLSLHVKFFSALVYLVNIFTIQQFSSTVADKLRSYSRMSFFRVCDDCVWRNLFKSFFGFYSLLSSFFFLSACQAKNFPRSVIFHMYVYSSNNFILARSWNIWLLFSLFLFPSLSHAGYRFTKTNLFFLFSQISLGTTERE
jgi:hypothetical protein